MKRSRSAISRANQAAGSAFEEWIDRQHERAGLLGILAHVEHNQPHSRVVGGRVVYSGKGISDYTGVLFGGRVLAVEAKSTSEPVLYRKAIQKKQAEHLDAVSRARGLALLLIEFRYVSGILRFAVEWDRVPWKIKARAESVAEDDLWQHVVGQGCYLKKFHYGSSERAVLGRKRVYARE